MPLVLIILTDLSNLSYIEAFWGEGLVPSLPHTTMLFGRSPPRQVPSVCLDRDSEEPEAQEGLAMDSLTPPFSNKRDGPI
jgi:hypothetical protein